MTAQQRQPHWTDLGKLTGLVVASYGVWQLFAPAGYLVAGLGTVVLFSIPLGVSGWFTRPGDWTDLGIVLGLALISYGAWQAYPPAGYISGGLGLVVLCFLAGVSGRVPPRGG